MKLISMSAYRTQRPRVSLGLRTLAISCALVFPSAGNGQAAQANQQPNDASKPQSATLAAGQSAALTPQTGEATIYVYRIGSMLGALARPTIFVNGDEVATLQNSRYALAKVPPGTANIAAAQIIVLPDKIQVTDIKGDLVFIPGPNATFSTTASHVLSGCEGTNFVSLRSELVRLWVLGKQGPVQREDTTRCQASLREVLAAMAANFPHRLVPVKAMQTCYLHPFGTGEAYNAEEVNACYSQFSAALKLLAIDTAPAGRGPTRIAIPVEAGKAYYIRWSVSSRGGAIKPVDEKTGAKAVRKLHLSNSNPIDPTH